ncbi:MAG: glycosyltransferase family 4 protein [Gammaproteobacteria bacterium]
MNLSFRSTNKNNKSILLIAPGLSLPSTLWMRRQLEMISDRVGYLFTDAGSAPEYSKKYYFVPLRTGAGRLSNRILHYLNLFRLFRAVHSKNIDVVFVHYATTAVGYKKVFLTTRKRVVVHCHGYDVTWGLRDPASGDPCHGARYVDQISSMPDNVVFIANSKRTIQRLLDIGIAHERIVLKYLGVDAPDIFPAKPGSADKLTVLYLGRLVDFKGPDIVIRAFEKACSMGFNGELIMAGDGPLRVTCELLAAHSPFSERISLLGAVDPDKGRKLMQEADIFTAHNCIGPLSGQEEAFGVTTIEAMAAGVPIINASSGSIPELIEDGVSGLLVQPTDINAHSEAFLKFRNSPELRQAIARNAWERVRDNFSIEQETRKLRKILSLDT